MNPDNVYLIGGTVVGALILLAIFFHYVPFVLWLSAKVSGVQISLMQLFLMRIRNVPPSVIVQAMIEAHKAGLENITRDSLEAHYLAGGNVERVVHALVSASMAISWIPSFATAVTCGVSITLGLTDICTASNTSRPARSMAVAIWNDSSMFAFDADTRACTTLSTLPPAR